MTNNQLDAEANHAAAIIVRDGIRQTRSSVEDWLTAVYDDTSLLERVMHLLGTPDQ